MKGMFGNKARADKKQMAKSKAKVKAFTTLSTASTSSTGFLYMHCMKRVYKDKNNASPLVSSQKRRALAVPLIKRFQNGCELRILFPHSRTCLA